MLICTLVISSCGTTEITCELRSRREGNAIERINLLQNTSMSSSKLGPNPVRQDNNYSYYEYSGLLHGGRKAFIVVDFGARSEIYNLSRSGLQLRSEWGSWIDPHFVQDEVEGGSVAFDVLYSLLKASAKEDSFEKNTNLRYKHERWDQYN